MSTGFLGLNTALSGLFANQRSLGIVSHNVANVGTEGFSRQVMHTKAYRPQVLPGRMGTLGLGVDVTAVKQIRDGYLDYKLRLETGIQKEWNARSDVLTEIEGIFNEPSDSSISKLLDQYYESLQTLQKNPENLTARTLVRQNTIAISEGVKRISGMLRSLQEDLNFQFKTAVGDINGIAQQIVKLSKAIYKAELEGGRANDIRDQRNVLVDKLSEYVKLDFYEDDKNRFFVLVGGQQLVAHFRADELKLVPRGTRVNEDDGDGIMDVEWANGNFANIQSGKLKGFMDIRDNVSGERKGIPYYVERLNAFIDTFANTFNAIHEEGYGLDGSQGSYMFTMDNMTTVEFKDYLLNKGLNGGAAINVTTSVLDGVSTLSPEEQRDKIYKNIETLLANNPVHKQKKVQKIDGNYYIVDGFKASRMSIARDLEDINKIAAALDPQDLAGDAANALRLIETRHDAGLYDWGAPEDFVKSLVSNLGVDSGEAQRMTKNQTLLVKEYSTARDSVMGVSLDEEMARMIQFQTAYNANARMVNVFDEMLDLLVNRLGIVGR